MLDYARTELKTGRIIAYYQGGEPELQECAEGEAYILLDERPGVRSDGFAHLVEVHPDGIRGTLVDRPPPPPPTLDQIKWTIGGEINEKRDQVIGGGFTFQGHRFQSRPNDRENIMQQAFMAALSGATAGDLRWHGGDEDFGWIAEDNSIVPMDKPTMLAFAQALAAFQRKCNRYARALKDTADAAADQAALEAIDISSGWP